MFVLIYKSPAGELLPAEFPLPAILILESLSTPAGIFIFIFSDTLTYPLPWQSLHVSIIFSPVPPQALQGEAKKPPSFLRPVP